MNPLPAPTSTFPLCPLPAWPFSPHSAPPPLQGRVMFANLEVVKCDGTVTNEQVRVRSEKGG